MNVELENTKLVELLKMSNVTILTPNYYPIHFTFLDLRAFFS